MGRQCVKPPSDMFGPPPLLCSARKECSVISPKPPHSQRSVLTTKNESVDLKTDANDSDDEVITSIITASFSSE